MEKITIRGEELFLHPEKALWWKSEHILVISDIHSGKTMHFRSQGIPVPTHAEMDNWGRLAHLLHKLKPHKLLILGDLFHSSYNPDWEYVHEFVRTFPQIEIVLVKGNHDILQMEKYEEAGIKCFTSLDIAPFSFTHKREDHPANYNICGHIHPAVLLRGYGRQKLKLSCFFLEEKYAILPAFGTFTGTYVMPVRKSSTVYVITGEKVTKAGN